MMVRLKYCSTAAALLSVAACGGGGGSGPASTASTPNQAPVITSPEAATVAENTTGTLYAATASDPDGGALTFSLAATNDAAVFTINSDNGVVTATPTLDFEAPGDGDADNIYEFTVVVTDSTGLIGQQVVRLEVTNVVEDMALRRVGQGFASPVFLTGLPGTAKTIVVELTGRLRVFDPATGIIDSVDFLDLTSQTSASGEGGILGLAFSPTFETDRRFYVSLTNLSGDTEIRRYQMFSGSDDQADPSTADLILQVGQPQSNHNGGWIGFSNDGLFFVPLGDGGGGGDPLEVAQDPSSLLGKVLRLDLSGDDFPGDDARDYRIPNDNPFADGTGGAPEIFALGLRNPFRCSFDPVTGDLFIADVGQNAVEEINRLSPNTGGVNFGWDQREGTQTFEGPNETGFTDPVAEYFHGTGPTQGRSVTGGYVHRGNIEPMKDRYVFTDFISGNIWSVAEADLVNGSTVAASEFTRHNDQLVPDAGSLSRVASFGEDNDGQLYMLAIGGDIFRIESEE